MIAQRISSHRQPSLSRSLSVFGIENHCGKEYIYRYIYGEIYVYICTQYIRIYIHISSIWAALDVSQCRCFANTAEMFQPNLEQSVVSPERDPPEAEMHLCNPLFQRWRRSSGVPLPLQGQQSVTVAQLQSPLKAETTWLRLTLICFPADSCLTGAQTSFLISCVRLQLPTAPPPAFPCPILYITSSNKSLRSLSPVWSEENRPSSVSGGLMEKWKMRPCAHNLCQVVYFFTQPAAFSFSSPPHLQQHAQPENALIPHCHCQYKHRTCCFQGFFPHIQLPDWAANTAPHDYFISHWSRAHAHTRSWHISPQTFQNTLCHFSFLFSDKVKRQVSGPMPPADFKV